MKKIAKSLFAAVLVIVMCFTSIPVFASEMTPVVTASVTPRWSHLNSATFSFSATESGGHTAVEYLGYSDSFAKAEVNIKVQKRLLFVFWTDVGEWSASSVDEYNVFAHTFSLSGSGTYKATFTLTITGTDGTVDTLTDSRESSY